MVSIFFLATWIGIVLAAPIEQVPIKSNRIPTVQEAALVARTLVSRESLTNINTFRTSEINGEQQLLPVSTVEYYADCDNDGDPYWLVVDIGSTYQNIQKGSAYTFTIRVGDHPANDDVDVTYPGGIENSPAGSPRINLVGHLQDVVFDSPIELVKLNTCFLKRHPDAKWWLPGNKVSPHKSHWMKFVVDEVHMIGGFGDRAYIGTIDSQTYHEARVLE